MYCPCLSAVVADRPLSPATRHRLGRPLPHQLANSARAHPLAIAKRPSFSRRTYAVLTSISRGYPSLKGRFSRVTQPSAAVLIPEGTFSLDLHVLGAPPAFILSQDQTLHHRFELGLLKKNSKYEIFSCVFQRTFFVSNFFVTCD